MGRRPGVIAALALAACAPGDDERAGAVRLSFDTERPGSGCASDDCEDYGLSCGATMLVRWIDEDTGEVALSTDGQPLEECRALAPAESMCALRVLDPPLTFFGVPEQDAHLRVEVALWAPDQVAANACPEGRLFDLRGVPLAIEPQPAFAGAAHVQTSDQDSVRVEMTCSDPTQLDAAECALDPSIRVEAQLTDLASVLSVTATQAENLSVDAAEPITVPLDGGGTQTVIDATSVLPLPLLEVAPVPTFGASTSQAFGTTVCTQVLEVAPQATTAVTCEPVLSGSRRLDLHGLLVPKEIVDAALAALGEPAFPTTGLVIGRVVDAASSPQGGVEVEVEGGTVLYFDPQFGLVPGGQTAASGYFLSTDAPFGARLSARHTSDGRREDASYRAGLVRGRLTAVVVRLEGDVIAP